MKVVYYSLTGNVRRFIGRTGLTNTLALNESNKDIKLDEPFVVVTGSIGFGQVPETVQTFLQANHHYLKGVVGSGNKNWGQNYAKAGDTIAENYQVPLLMKFELHGTQQQANEFKEKVVNLNENDGQKEIQSH